MANIFITSYIKPLALINISKGGINYADLKGRKTLDRVSQIEF